jgi:very-short-patch-repair endonuclease
VPGFSAENYRGTLCDIVREVKRLESKYDWMPSVPPATPDTPPLSHSELIEVWRLIQTDTPFRRGRSSQVIPSRDQLPSSPEVIGILRAEAQARAAMPDESLAAMRKLAAAGSYALNELKELAEKARLLFRQLGLPDTGTLPDSSDGPSWITRALKERFAGHHEGLWAPLIQTRREPTRLLEQLNHSEFTVELNTEITSDMLGAASGWLNQGRALLDELRNGGKLRSRFPTRAQRDAAGFLAAIRVDGGSPATVVQLEAALRWMEAEVGARRLASKWSDVDVGIQNGTLRGMLSDLDSHAAHLTKVEALTAIRTRVAEILEAAGVRVDLSCPADLEDIWRGAAAAEAYVEIDRASARLTQLQDKIGSWASRPDACSEIVALVTSLEDRDAVGYANGLECIEAVRLAYHEELRRAALERAMEQVHPALIDLLRRTAHDPAWEKRLATLRQAWAWAKARQFVEHARNADHERLLSQEFERVEDRIKQVTAELAGIRAKSACLGRMTDTQARALRTYRSHMERIGAGTGTRTREFRKAARAAMVKAQDAVPAWVVPLPNLLDNIQPQQNSFDFIIVDEASQVGIEHLFLLWMAPRVIVVGDDKQCSPGVSRLGKHDPLFSSLHEDLSDLAHEIRLLFTPQSNFYGMLSSRSGKDAVVRLREHFRCMPEIINWSSSQFYGEKGRPGLIPLRERKGDDLEPLKVVEVTGAYVEGREARQRNRVEADAIVDQLLACIEDPRYLGKSFGIVVLLAGAKSHIQYLEQRIKDKISAQDREERNIRVGIAPTFQGDERDIIFLSMVVADSPRAGRATSIRQSYNVATTRARDQLWLFTSVSGSQLKPDDLRASLYAYMKHPPSVYGASPALEMVRPDRLIPPFESLFEQRVFRDIKQRGYEVVPQHQVGNRSLDLVVVGEGGRLGVECDGHYWHAGLTREASDARRDSELRRMGWDVIRIRESEYEFEPEHELGALWGRLNERDIHPRPTMGQPEDTWMPIDLPDEDEPEAGQGLES